MLRWKRFAEPVLLRQHSSFPGTIPGCGSSKTAALIKRSKSKMARRQNRINAAYYRGGTSRGLIFKRSDLPKDQNNWGPIFCGALGSPDPNGRQLDGLGTGIGSLSKICVVEPSNREDADIDYTFVQIGIKDGAVDYSSNCGNMSSAVGPFAVESGMVPAESDGEATVRIFNTNTKKLIKSRFQVRDREAVADGPLAIAGVAGTGAKVELAFVNPAGSRTGKLLPTGRTRDVFDGISASCVDVGNPCVFVQARELGVDGAILPEEAEAHPDLVSRLEYLRRKAAVAMGLAPDEASVPDAAPKILMVSPPSPYSTLSGEKLSGDSTDLIIRSLSGMGFHRALQITASLATAVAAKINGTVVAANLVKKTVDADGIILGHPSGTLLVTAKFDAEGSVSEATVFRTARRIMEGQVFWRGVR
jgi:2-methylaconitate cis-trans-isomerase PrpF